MWAVQRSPDLTQPFGTHSAISATSCVIILRESTCGMLHGEVGSSGLEGAQSSVPSVRTAAPPG
ncbi:unnamed protein product [Prunus armeniaca]|uniref:Uncharacterized protein n=1 Tax=Prunus armeniaca TaxID=36596 RepID=A0A6J5TPG6_PRUAR|nr:unnamed protein product [Prunus armeniaca]